MGINIRQIDLRIKPKNRLWGCNSVKTAYFALFALSCNKRRIRLGRHSVYVYPNYKTKNKRDKEIDDDR
jgi:hypothetical protein